MKYVASVRNDWKLFFIGRIERNAGNGQNNARWNKIRNSSIVEDKIKNYVYLFYVGLFLLPPAMRLYSFSIQPYSLFLPKSPVYQNISACKYNLV